MRKPLVSIVMPTYNAQKYLNASIHSILNQTISDWELLIIDDASTDETLVLLNKFKHYNKIRIYRNRKNLGHAISSNLGINYATGKYIAKMDSDDICLPKRLERQIKILESDSSIDAVGCGTIKTDKDLQIIDIRHPPTNHISICNYINFNKDIVFGPNFLITDGTLVAKSEWFKKWKYDENIKVAQDFDLMLRACLYSKYANVESPLYVYRRVGETSTFYKQAIGAKTKLISIVKYENHFGKRILGIISCVIRPFFVMLTIIHHFFLKYSIRVKKYTRYQRLIDKYYNDLQKSIGPNY